MCLPEHLPPGLRSLLFLPQHRSLQDESVSPESMTSLCNRQKKPHYGPETESWAACLGIGSKSSSHLQGYCCLKKQTAGDAGSEGQPSPCGLAEEEVIV